jgi:uncharacterized protein
MCGYYAPVVSRPFQLFVKPAGAACNLACRYCYYRGHAGEATAPARMDDGLLESYVEQHIAAAPSAEVLFSWHGGEPTLLGLEFFDKVVALQARHAVPGRRVLNGIQTNGVLVDDRWGSFFARHRFRVGLSLDGPADLHDRCRLNHGGAGSHAAALRAFDCLSRHRVPIEILCVVHAENAGQPLRVYRFLRKIGARAIGFLPVVRPDPGAHGGVTAESVPPDAYGRFLCAVFDEWVDRDEARIQVQLFDEASRPARGLDHGLCVFRPTCGDVPVLERNGSVYACDHFVNDAHCLGNLGDQPLASLLEHPALLAFGEAKQSPLPRQCRDCDLLPMCNGGCPKDRFVAAGDGGPNVNYLCPAYQAFFAHVLPWAVRRALEARAANPTVAWLAKAAADTRPSNRGAGRNDPCPCGSGKKYKKCCAGG